MDITDSSHLTPNEAKSIQEDKKGKVRQIKIVPIATQILSGMFQVPADVPLLQLPMFAMGKGEAGIIQEVLRTHDGFYDPEHEFWTGIPFDFTSYDNRLGKPYGYMATLFMKYFFPKRDHDRLDNLYMRE